MYFQIYILIFKIKLLWKYMNNLDLPWAWFGARSWRSEEKALRSSSEVPNHAHGKSKLFIYFQSSLILKIRI